MALSKHVCVEGSRFLGMLKKSAYNLKTVPCQDSVRVFLTIDLSSLWQTKSNNVSEPYHYNLTYVPVLRLLPILMGNWSMLDGGLSMIREKKNNQTFVVVDRLLIIVTMMCNTMVE